MTLKTIILALSYLKKPMLIILEVYEVVYTCATLKALMSDLQALLPLK